jgi:hypothetical protein
MKGIAASPIGSHAGAQNKHVVRDFLKFSCRNNLMAILKIAGSLIFGREI